MRKALVFVALALGFGFLASRMKSRMENINWEAKFERMPDNAPPKWMFRNISAIRENTDRMRELLEKTAPAA